MLTRYLADSLLAAKLVSRDELVPFPSVIDRAFWNSRPGDYRERVVERADECLGREWAHIPPAAYLEYFRSSDRGKFEAYYHPRRIALGVLTLAECLTNEGRYLEAIANVVWAICEESTWILPAHISEGQEGGLPRPDTWFFDITSARTAADLGLARQLLADSLDALDPALNLRVESEIARRVARPYIEHDEFWWMHLHPQKEKSLNNWNAWCNFGGLAAALLVLDDPLDRLAAARRYLSSVEVLLDYYHGDGGCDEGPGYWSHAMGSVFEGLELLWGASNGYIDVYGEPKIANMARYIMAAHVADDAFVNFADCVPRLRPPAGLIHQLGRRIGDGELASFARYLWSSSRNVMGEELSKALHLAAAFPEIDEPGEAPLPQSRFWRGIDVAIAREAPGSTAGFFLAARGGSNGESHSHNDVGSFMVYLDGDPLVIDPGVESYKRETFSGDRYSIWTMQSNYHNLPIVAGSGQLPGWDARADHVRFEESQNSVRLSCDLARCYPADSGIVEWVRTSMLNRGGEGSEAGVEIRDDGRLDHEGVPIEWVLMLPAAPRVIDESTVVLVGANATEARLVLSAENLERGDPVVERIALDDRKMNPYWGDEIYRLLVPATATATRFALRLVLRA